MGDAAFMLALMRSPGWLEFIGDRHVYSIEDAQKYLRNGFLSSYENLGFGYYLITGNGGEKIGIMGFSRKAFLHNLDFGFALMPEWHGKGLAYEAGLALLKYAKVELQLEVLDAVANLDNTASHALLKKLKFDDKEQVYDEAKSMMVRLFRWHAN
jgi:RimJ/RimL family protein N-acetyltransferase